MSIISIPEVPFRFLKNAKLGPDGDRHFSVIFGSEVTDLKNFKAVNVIIHDPRFIFHYFHFLEIALCLYIALREFTGAAEPSIIAFTSSNWTNPIQGNIQEAMLRTLFPAASLQSPDLATCLDLENVIYIDRDLSIRKINKFLEPVLSFGARWVQELVFKVQSRTGSLLRPAHSRNFLRALYVHRPPPRRLANSLQTELFDKLYDRGITVEEIDFAQLSWSDQVRISAGADLMVGVHRNGLSNILWAPPHAALLEFFPAGAHHYDYQIFAELAHRTYFCV